MPRRTSKCVRIRQVNGIIYARFNDKVEKVFESRADMNRWIRDTISDEVIKAMVLAAVVKDADGVPLSQCDGKRLTLDFSTSPQLTVVQE